MSVDIPKVFDTLEQAHGGLTWHWTDETPAFDVCAGAILVQNTTWTNAERALARLHAADVRSVEALAATPADLLEDLVRPAGQFRQKARKLRAFAAASIDAGGLERLLELPSGELADRLLATWGIGPETADCIRCYAAGHDVLVVDAYTVRLFRRLGTGPESDTYGAWQEWLTRGLGESARWPGSAGYGRAHALVVLHGKHLCRKRAPRCDACPLAPQCGFAANDNDPRVQRGSQRTSAVEEP
ncbi:MAG: endonuclease III [Tepidiforma sp.]|nr:MAG: endonuclease III [Tepidiforma sp.]